MLDKKAQVGDTLTWLVATIIIFVFLLLFILGASLLGKTKSLSPYKPDLFSKSSYKIHDAFLTKSLFTYLYLEDTIPGNDLKLKLQDIENAGKFKESLSPRLGELKKRALT